MTSIPIDPVLSAIRGGQEASAVLAEIRRGCTSPDALHEALHRAIQADDADLLRSFARSLQKNFERAK